MPDITTVLAIALFAALGTIAVLVLAQSRVIVGYDKELDILTVRRVGIPYERTVVGIMGDVVYDTAGDGTIVGIAITCTDRFRGRMARHLLTHPDRAAVPRVLWNEMEVWLRRNPHNDETEKKAQRHREWQARCNAEFEREIAAGMHPEVEQLQPGITAALREKLARPPVGIVAASINSSDTRH